jgi:hypothetical protein
MNDELARFIIHNLSFIIIDGISFAYLVENFLGFGHDTSGIAFGRDF